MTSRSLTPSLNTLGNEALEFPITDYLEAQLARSPDWPAVAFEGTTLTYAELHRRANRVARELAARGIGKDALVGVYMDRSIEMVVALLAVVKAGGAYVPLDPEYPHDRLAMMFDDSDIEVVLTQRKFEKTELFHGLGVLYLDDPFWLKSEAGDDISAPPACDPDSAVYMIYTSGSTGKPKGVVNVHRGLVNRLLWMQDAFNLGEGDRVLQKTPYSFDVSVWEFFWPLITGACIVVARPGGHRDNDYLVRTIVDAKITTIHFVPSMLSLFLTAENLDRITALRQVMSSGEALPLDLTRRFFAKLPNAKLHNLYGPTEAAIDVTHWECTPESTKNVVPIGRAIANIQLYVLDETMAQVPAGETGELHIGGVGLARGYWNRPELTAERFVKNPFSDDPTARLYKTGDLSRVLPDGSIEYLGRLDFQVKLRGFRIELGEIEAVLLKHPKVREAVVTATEETLEERQLVAYIVCENGERPATDALRDTLLAELPEYMVPARFVFLDEMPLSPNGKVDRKALPKNFGERPQLSEMYVAPKSPLHKQLCDIWADLLGVSQIGIRDNFFEVGGNSIRAVRLAAEIKRVLHLDVPVVKIFEHPSIEKLARHLSEGHSSKLLDDAYERATRLRIGRFADDRADGIAVIGMVGRFPGAANLDQLWQNLCNKVESISRFSLDEIGPGIDDETKNDPDYVPTRGIIDDADKFDARFFGIGPLEAKAMDPQQRVFLELAWAALENAGYDSERFAGMIGVYAGVGDNHYYTNNVLAHPDIVKTVGKMIVGYGNEKDYIATRASFALNLTGPAVSANTGCSTSLLAVDNAFKALIDFECDMAIAGGVDVFFPQKSGQLYKEGGTFTKDGHCRPFDAEATGTMFCDGAGVVVLRRLQDAIDAGDRIYAVIRGIAKNNDGANKVSFLAPSVDGQAKVIAMAQAQANVLAETISYVEAHGTGTPLGDPIEVEALTRAFRATTQKKQFCYLGSVKGNIGHPTIASGVAGLIKACLALYHEKIPGTLHFNRPNPRINFEDSPFKIITDTTPWPRSDRPRRAAVSSFGFGGTNVHAVLEEAPLPAAPTPPSRPQQLLLLSGKSEAAVGRLCESFASAFADNPTMDLADAAFTTQMGRKPLAFRQCVVAGDAEEASKNLAAAKKAPVAQLTALDPDVVFLFPGQGSQVAGMGSGLYATEAVFREAIDACCAGFKQALDFDLKTLLFPNPGEEAAANEQLKDTRLTQPALFTVEYALARLWMSLGVVPKALVGHSVAEFVCATIAGSIALDDAIRLVALRGKLMGSMPPGSMLSVRAAAATIAPRLPSDLQLAANNAPNLCVVAGPKESIAAFAAELEKESIVARLLQTSHAFHSSMMEPIVGEFMNAVAGVTWSAPQIPIVSTCLGEWMTAETLASPAYWGKQLRMAVLFSDAIRKLVEPAGRVFLEVGPKDVLSTLTRQHVSPKQRAFIVPTIGNAEAKDELPAFLRALGELWKLGVSIDWVALHNGEARRRLPLPTYPFERTSYWLEPARTTASPQFPAETHTETEQAAEGTGEAAKPRTIATRIADMIAMVAGIPADVVDPARTYLELGLDSLSLMQLEVVVHKEFGVKVTWRQLLEDHSTPAKLEALVRASATVPLEAPVVAPAAAVGVDAATTVTAASAAIQGLTALREAGPRRLFLAYDGEGDVLQYLKLARSMPPEFSIYGLSPLRMPNIPQAHTNVEDMARHCLSVVKQKQPTGPYMFGGLCAGGVIAFEMARQLEAAGEKVDWVVLFDAINPQARFRPFLETRDRLKRFFKNAKGSAAPGTAPKADATSTCCAAPPPKRGVGDTLTYASQKLRNVITYEAHSQADKAWIAARVVLLRQLVKRNQPWPGWLPPLREMDIFMHIKGDYRPTPINADIALVRAALDGEGPDTPAHHYVADPVFGWTGQTRGKMELIDSEGGHVSMLLDEPWFGELAEKLANVLLSKTETGARLRASA